MRGGPMITRSARTMVALASAIGCALGAFTLAGAMSGPHEAPPSRGSQQDAAQAGPFARTTGSEDTVFRYALEELTDTKMVSVGSVTDDGACLNLALPNGVSVVDFCMDRATVSSGLGYGAFSQEDGSFFVVGMVPDEVDTVLVGDQAVSVEGGIWSITLPRGPVSTLRVGNRMTNTWVVL